MNVLALQNFIIMQYMLMKWEKWMYILKKIIDLSTF